MSNRVFSTERFTNSKQPQNQAFPRPKKVDGFLVESGLRSPFVMKLGMSQD